MSRTANICATCWQNAGQPCISLLTGRKLAHWHNYPKPLISIEVSENVAKQRQQAVAETLRALADPPLRRSDNSVLSERLAKKVETFKHSPQKARVGLEPSTLTPSQLTGVAISRPERLKRRDL